MIAIALFLIGVLLLWTSRRLRRAFERRAVRRRLFLVCGRSL